MSIIHRQVAWRQHTSECVQQLVCGKKTPCCHFQVAVITSVAWSLRVVDSFAACNTSHYPHSLRCSLQSVHSRVELEKLCALLTSQIDCGVCRDRRSREVNSLGVVVLSCLLEKCANVIQVFKQAEDVKEFGLCFVLFDINIICA